MIRARAGRHTAAVCYLHIGTHKTGTTSLQTTLAAHAGALRRAGVLVPRQGRSEAGGHHNLAWELSGDGRFDARRGTVATVLREVRRSRAPTVSISSEDFEYLHDRPRELRRVVDGFARIGYAVAAVIYLRPQASYAESLYAELVKHGFASRFDEYLAEIVRDGAVTFGSWRFTFDYARLVDDFAAVFGQRGTIVRSYTGEIAGGAIVRDYLELLGVPPAALALVGRQSAPRVNASASFRDVVRRFDVNAAAEGRTLAPLPDSAAWSRARFDPLRLPDVARLAQRFAAGNQHVFRRYGAAVPLVTRRDLLSDIVAALGLDPAGETRRAVLAAVAPRAATSAG